MLLRRLKARSQFVATAKGVRAHRPTLSLQRRDRADGDDAIGVGFTVTNKEGNSPERNRIRRRFRAIARDMLPAAGSAGCDYVIIGRRAALDCPFPSLTRDLKEALAEAEKRAAKGAKGAPPTLPSTD
ncbi:MAG: ribonuclease P protein component [Micropepsaceae bacterium]